MVASRTTEPDVSPAGQGVRPRCSACGQVVPTTARECPFCGRSLLVDLVVDGAVDGRRSARLAGELAGVVQRDREELSRRLSKAPGTVVEGLIRTEALACQGVLEREGVSSRVIAGRQAQAKRGPRETVGRPVKRRRSRPGLVLAGRLLALGLVAAAAVWWFARPGGAPGDRADRERPPGFGRGVSDDRRVWVEPEELAPDRARLTGGFAVSDRTVITSASVVGGAGDRVRVDGRTLGRVVATDEWLGVAVVEVSERVGETLVLGDGGRLQAGDEVRLPGTAAAAGTVVQTPVRYLGLAWIELDAPVAESDSGGPVLGPAGEVVGVLQRFPGVDGPRTLVLPANYLTAGPEPLVRAGSAEPTEPWQRLLERAGLGVERRPELLAAELERTILLRAQLEQGRALRVGLALLSTRAPAGGEVELGLVRGGETLCTFRGQVAMWHPIRPEEVEVELPREARWLERRGQPLYLYSSELELGLAGCDEREARGAELVVRGGLPGADRCQLESRSPRLRSSSERRRSRG